MQRQTVLQLQSLHFRGAGGPGSEPIRLRDPRTDAWIGGEAEWVLGARNQPVAFIRGQRPSVAVGLQAGWFAPPEVELSAWGAPLGHGAAASNKNVRWLGPHRVKLSENDRRIRFVSAGAVPFGVTLPDEIGRHLVELDWYAEWTESGQPIRLFLGRTSLVLCTTWRPMVDDPDRSLEPWAYAPLMEWSCAWARGATSPKEICDLLLRNLPATGLQYGVPGWDVRSMLLNGGGMCGGWYQLFAQLANCQGVALSLETLMLPAGPDAPWGGLVVTTPGLNQGSPSFGVAVEGHYRDTSSWPPPPAEALREDTTRRYFFGQAPDGHCINMLDGEDGTVTVYDPSYQVVSPPIELRPPPPEGRVDRFPGTASFRTRYFDAAIRFLMSQRDKLRFDSDPLAFGVTVGSPVIPEIAIVWNQEPAQGQSRPHLIDKLRQVVTTYLTEPELAAWLDRIRRLEQDQSTSAQLLVQALDEAKQLSLKRGAPVPHAMHLAELLQFALLELLEADGKAQGAREALERLRGEAVSPRLRALARRLSGGAASG